MPCLYKSTLGTVFDYLGIDLETKCGQLRQRRQLKQCGQLRQLVTKILRLIQHHSTAPRAPCAPYCYRLSVAPTPRSQSARLMMSVRMCQGMMLLHGVAAPIWSNCSSNGLRYWDSYDFDFCNRWVCGFSEWYFLVIRGQLASTNIQNLCNHRDFNVFLCWFYDTKPLSFLKMFFIFLKFLFLFTFRIFQERCHPQTPPCRQEDPLQTWRDVFLSASLVSIQVVRTCPFYKQLVEVIASIPYPWRLAIICNDT